VIYEWDIKKAEENLALVAVQGPRTNVGYRFAQLLRQWLIEEEPRHLTQPAS
jgi:hypothetical protein